MVSASPCATLRAAALGTSSATGPSRGGAAAVELNEDLPAYLKETEATLSWKSSFDGPYGEDPWVLAKSDLPTFTSNDHVIETVIWWKEPGQAGPWHPLPDAPLPATTAYLVARQGDDPDDPLLHLHDQSQLTLVEKLQSPHGLVYGVFARFPATDQANESWWPMVGVGFVGASAIALVSWLLGGATTLLCSRNRAAVLARWGHRIAGLGPVQCMRRRLAQRPLLRLPTARGAFAVGVLFVLLLVGFAGLAYPFRDAPVGTLGHTLAGVLYPDHARWVENKDALEHEVARLQRFADMPSGTLLDAARSNLWVTSVAIREPGSSRWEAIDNFDSNLIRQYWAQPGIDLYEPPSTAAPTTVLAGERTLFEDGGRRLGYFVSPLFAAPAELSVAAWVPSLRAGALGACALLLCGSALVGRKRPTPRQLNIASQLLPAARREGWKQFVWEVWDNTGSRQERRSQMRSLLVSLPATAIRLRTTRSLSADRQPGRKR